MNELEFEWDENKNTINKKKHNISLRKSKLFFTTRTHF